MEWLIGLKQLGTLRSGVHLLGAVTAIATCLGFAGHFWWRLSFLDYPRPQYCLILLIAGLVQLIHRHEQVWSLVFVLPLLVNLWCLWPLVVPASAIATPSLGQTVNLLHMTLDRDNLDLQPAIAYANRQPADLLSVLEVTPESIRSLETGLTRYQLVAAEPRTNSHGSAWFVAKQPQLSIQPLASQVIHLPASSDRPILQITTTVAGRSLTVICFHSIRPQSAGSVAYQEVEFRALTDWQHPLQNQRRLGIAIGDFNSTPWATAFRRMMQASDWHNSQAGFGLQPTWPSVLPTFLRIAIDHCLHSPELRTIQRGVGDNVGSDHLPLWVTLEVSRVE